MNTIPLIGCEKSSEWKTEKLEPYVNPKSFSDYLDQLFKNKRKDRIEVYGLYNSGSSKEDFFDNDNKASKVLKEMNFSEQELESDVNIPDHFYWDINIKTNYILNDGPIFSEYYDYYIEFSKSLELTVSMVPPDDDLFSNKVSIVKHYFTDLKSLEMINSFFRKEAK